MNLLTFIGLLLGITGIGIVFYENAFQHHPEGFIFGVGLSVTAMLTWSIGTIIIVRKKTTLNPYYATGWQMLIGSFILFIIAETTQPTIPFKNISATAWGAITYLVVAGSLVAFIAFIYSMKKLPAAISSLYAYINPLVAMVTAYFVLDEKLTIYIFWGAVVTLAGVFLVNFSLKRNRDKFIAEPEQ